MSKMPVVCYTEDRQRIDVVVDPDPVDGWGTFLVCNLRDAVKEKCKPFYDSIPAHQIPIALRGDPTPLKGADPLRDKEYQLLKVPVPTVEATQEERMRQKRSRTILGITVTPQGVELGDQQYKHEDVGIILSVGGKDVKTMTLLEVCKSLKNAEEITLHNNEVCVVKKATNEINFSSVNSQPSWERLHLGDITETFFSADDTVFTIPPPISLAQFVWKESQDGSPDNVSACLSHLRTLLKLPEAYDVYRSVAVEISSDSLVLKGTIGDFAVRLKNDTTFSFVTSILEVKKNVSDGDQFQAGVELVGMETLLRRMVPGP